MEEDALASAAYADFSDQRMDSCNTRKSGEKQDKPLTKLVTDESGHMEFWQQAITKIGNMRYVDKNTFKPLPNPPSLVNWRYTLHGIRELWRTVKKKGFRYLQTGYVNQDPLENFFGALRSYGRRYVTPTCWQSEGVYKSLLVNNLVSKHSSGANCLDDKGKSINLLTVLSKAENLNTENSGNRSHEFDEPEHAIQKQAAENKSSFALLCRIQSAGNFAKTVLKQVQGVKSCENCNQAFFCDDPQRNEYISLMRKHKCEVLNTTAADYFERGYTQAGNVVNRQLQRGSWKPFLRQRLIKFLISEKKVDFEWISCSEHRLDVQKKFVENIVHHNILRWCIHINRLLSGRTSVHRGTFLEIQALKKYQNTLKRKAGVQKQ